MVEFTKIAFPCLEWTANHSGNSRPAIRFDILDKQAKNYIDKSSSFKAFISLLGSDYYEGSNIEEKEKMKMSLPDNSLPNRNLYIKSNVFYDIDGNKFIGSSLWQNVPLLPNWSGSLFFKNGGQYLYRICSLQDTDFLVKTEKINNVPPGARWGAFAFFIENSLLGFEEGYFTSDQIYIRNNGYYFTDTEKGEYLSFVCTVLSMIYVNNLQCKVIPAKIGDNQTNYEITVLDYQV